MPELSTPVIAAAAAATVALYLSVLWYLIRRDERRRATKRPAAEADQSVDFDNLASVLTWWGEKESA